MASSRSVILLLQMTHSHAVEDGVALLLLDLVHDFFEHAVQLGARDAHEHLPLILVLVAHGLV